MPKCVHYHSTRHATDPPHALFASARCPRNSLLESGTVCCPACSIVLVGMVGVMTVSAATDAPGGRGKRSGEVEIIAKGESAGRVIEEVAPRSLLAVLALPDWSAALPTTQTSTTTLFHCMLHRTSYSTRRAAYGNRNSQCFMPVH